MWKNQGSWNSFHAKLIPNSRIVNDFIIIKKAIWAELQNKMGEFAQQFGRICSAKQAKLRRTKEPLGKGCR